MLIFYFLFAAYFSWMCKINKINYLNQINSKCNLIRFVFDVDILFLKWNVIRKPYSHFSKDNCWRLVSVAKPFERYSAPAALRLLSQRFKLRFDRLVSIVKPFERYSAPASLSLLLWRFKLRFDRLVSVVKPFERYSAPAALRLLLQRFKLRFDRLVSVVI